MTGAIILAAGGSQRMGGVDKTLAFLEGIPVIVRAVFPFHSSPLIDKIVLVCSAENEAQCREIFQPEQWTKIAAICLGGERRQDSVQAGLKKLSDCEWVLIHDGARPLVTEEIIELGMEAAKETGAAIAAMPVKDTIKVAGPDRVIMQTPPRPILFAAQTPQIFRFDIIDKAYREVTGDFTDDSAAVEQTGVKVMLFEGSYRNIKITTPDDIACAEGLIRLDLV